MRFVTVIIIFLICLVETLQADVYPALPYGRLLNRFNDLVTSINNNNGMISAVDRTILERLKQDMMEDCAAGRLQDTTEYNNYDFRKYAGVPSRAYRVMVSEDITQDKHYWVLPQVNCNSEHSGVNPRSHEELAMDHFEVYPALPYGRLLNKFHDIVKNTKDNNGLISAKDQSTLGHLTQDMLEDCAVGKLQEYTGYDKNDFQNSAGIPTKVYRVMVSEEVTRDTHYWVLPQVNCKGEYRGVNPRSHEELAMDHFEVYPALPYGRLLNKFHDIVKNTKDNNGLITATDQSTLGQLTQDMLEDCAVGKLQEYTGYDKNDFQNSAGIPTKVYRVMVSEEVTRDSHYWVLPEVNCNGARGVH